MTQSPISQKVQIIQRQLDTCQQNYTLILQEKDQEIMQLKKQVHDTLQKTKESQLEYSDMMREVNDKNRALDERNALSVKAIKTLKDRNEQMQCTIEESIKETNDKSTQAHLHVHSYKQTLIQRR